MSSHSHLDASAGQAPARSMRSLAFEAFWRDLPKEGLVPLRSAFRPERAAPFLRDLLLLEPVFGASPVLRVRLAGSAFEARLGRSLTSENYFDYFAPPHRARALANTQIVVQRPCGRWTWSPVHYERGYAQMIEATMFPLLVSGDGPSLILMLANPIGIPILAAPTGGQAMHAHAPTVFGFIDIGAGIP